MFKKLHTYSFDIGMDNTIKYGFYDTYYLLNNCKIDCVYCDKTGMVDTRIFRKHILEKHIDRL